MTPDGKDDAPAVAHEDREYNIRDRTREDEAARAYITADSNSTQPLPYDKDAPPLPDEPVPTQIVADEWTALFDENTKYWYYRHNKSGHTQWENPHLHLLAPDKNSASSSAVDPSSGAGTSSPPKPKRWGGYNPKIHGSYDPTADYAIEAEKEQEEEEKAAAVVARLQPTQGYTTQAQFNRFTGKFQQAGMGPEQHNDENKSKRQMAAFFDVDAAANSHDGRSLKAERRNKTLSKQELKAFKEKRHHKKEERRRAWLKD